MSRVRNWYLRLRAWLTDEQGFEPSHADPCVFLKKTASGVIMLGVYVDDLLIVISKKVTLVPHTRPCSRV